MENLSNIGTIKEVLARHGFRFSKSLGQNFLINPSVCPRMADAVFENDDAKGVLEVGPGIGVLTDELAQRAEKVVSVELDRKLLPVLSETLAEFENVHVVHGDVLKLELKRLLEEEFGSLPYAFCANLPYYITSPVLMLLLESKLPFTSIVVMVQREASERLTASVGTRQAGAITVAVNYHAHAETLFQVSRGSFMPSPNVDSTVIRLTPREAPAYPVHDEKSFFAMVKAGFAQRRKTFVNAVNSGLDIEKDVIREALKSLDIIENIRTEALSMQQLSQLSNVLF